MGERLPALAIAAPAAPTSAMLDLEVRHRLSRPDASVAAYLDRLMGMLCGVAQAGGFWPGGRADQRMAIEWLSPTEDINGDLVLHVRASSLDAGVWQCWRHMVSRLIRLNMDVVGIAVTAQAMLMAANPALSQWLQIEPVDERNEAEAYPLASPELMAVLAFEDNDAANSRRFLVEIDRPVQPDEVGAFEVAVQPWYAMLETAAFCLPIGEAHEEQCLGGAVSQFDPCTIELGVDRFRASEQAWMVLGNLTLHWWRQRAHVVRVLVD